MKAIILAAGMGTRMGDLTKDKPKCTLKFLGSTLIERQIKTIKEAGIDDIIIVTGYMPHMIESPGCIKVENRDYDKTNMVESLFCTRDHWNDEIIVSYGDIIYEIGILKQLMDSNNAINVIVDLNGASYFKDRFGDNFLSETESLIMDDEGCIVDIGEPCPDISKVQGQYIGLMKFSLKGLGIISRVYDRDKKDFWDRPWLRSKNFQNGYMTDMLQRVIDLGDRVKAVCVTGGWLEFDSFKDYHKYLSWHEQNQLEKFYSLDK